MHPGSVKKGGFSMSTTSRILTVSIALGVFPGTVFAAIINVPADQLSIQAGVDASGPFDTVLVAPGTYVENILMEQKAVYLASHYLLAQDTGYITTTILDGSQPTSPDSGSAVRIVNCAFAVVEGFTITGGTGTAWRDQTDGHKYREGGGILTEGGFPIIRHNIIMGNRADDKSGGMSSAGGGAVRCGYGQAEVSHNVMAYNTGRYGGAVVAFHNPITMRNNIVWRNSGGEDYGGGGLWITSSDGNLVENNTITENNSASDGGGVLLWSNPTCVLPNNIVWGNMAGNGPQIRVRSGQGVVTYSDIEGGWAGTGNTAWDPLFAASGLILQPTSPCVDSGNPGFSIQDPADLASQGSALFPAQGARRNDMGAYGGPGCRPFPVFDQPGLGVSTVPLNYDTVAVAASGTGGIAVTKAAFGWAVIDSVRFSGAFASDLSLAFGTPLPMGPAVADSLDSLVVTWTPSTYGHMTDTAWVFHNVATLANPVVVELVGYAPGTTGDPNMDGAITSSDVIYMVNYTFKGGPSPLPVLAAGDVNCDGAITSADIISLVNYVFKGGTPPCN
jgi:hypothetical protein